MTHFWIILRSVGTYIGDQVPGAAISLIVAHLYFRRQRGLDESKEKAEVLLYYQKLVNAYTMTLGMPKVDPAIHDAMSELRTRLKIYRPEFDANEMLLQAGEEAKRRIRDNPQDFE